MKAASKPQVPPIRPLRWLQRLFSWQLRWRRVDGRWRLVFEDPRAVPAASAKARPASSAKPPGGERASTVDTSPDPMQQELHELLKQHAAARQLMRHLTYVENTLRLAGADRLGEVPLDVLRKALAQLEGLVTDWSSPGLAQLRLQLTMVIADKEEDAPAARERTTAAHS